MAVVCYLAAQSGAGMFCAFVLAHGIGWFEDRPQVANSWPWLIDSGWLLLFGLQHTGMARSSWKRVWEACLPAGLARSIYAALSGLLLLPLPWVWQSVGGDDLWNLPRWLILVPLLAAAGLALVNGRFDHAGLFGLRQAFADGDEPAEPLLVEGPYRFVRHPLMGCLLLFLWTQPHMSPTLAVFCGGLTLYIIVGVLFEERDLMRRFAPAYAAYRRRVPALVPWRRPVAPRRYLPGETFTASA
jgi:protein-S-isoprenylcysteine O-methyltransferase Ste14